MLGDLRRCGTYKPFNFNIMNNYKISSFHEVNINSYEEGELNHINNYSVDAEIKADSVDEAVQKYFAEILFYDFDSKMFGFSEDNKILYCSYLVDEDNNEVHVNSVLYERFKRSEIDLYNNNVSLTVEELKQVEIIL